MSGTNGGLVSARAEGNAVTARAPRGQPIVSRSASTFRAASLLAALVLVATALAVPVPVAGTPNTVRLVVTFRAGTPAGLAERVAAGGGSVVDRIEELNVRVVNVPAAAVEHSRGRWAATAEVASVETDGLLTADWLPPDPLWSYQWEQRQVRAPKAWSLERGAFTTLVAVVDTGVQLNHPDLSARLVSGYDFVNHDARPNDDNGHGTSVAGIVAATANSLGVAGMCMHCHVMPVKALDAHGIGYWTVAAKAIIWAANHHADVINMSFGGPTGGSTLASAIDYARSKGAVVIGAAGNDGLTTKFYPAAFAGVISVAAASGRDLRYDWSNYSTGWVDVAAPGCTWTTKLGSDYGSLCGTSAATPLVSGIAALIDSARPGLSRAQIESIITGATIRTPFNFTRFGRVDAFKAVFRAVRGRWPSAPLLYPSTPLLNPPAKVTFVAGAHAGYRFDSSGAIVRGAGLVLDANATAHTSKRGTIPGRGSGYWFFMVDGGLDGWWVPESGKVFLTPQPTPTPTPTPLPSASPTPSSTPTPAPTP
ncbi:MAG: S8 family serine peptidase [Chloroflexota bacterium]